MNDFTPETRALFGAAREATTPGADDRRRIAQSLGVALGSGSLASTLHGAGVSPTVPPPPSIAAPLAKGFLASAFVKAGAAVVLVSVAAVGTVVARKALHRAPRDGSLHEVPSAVALTVPKEQETQPNVDRDSIEVSPREDTVAEHAVSSARMHGKRSAVEGAAPDGPSGLQRETELLKAAQRALRSGHPADAMALLDEHARLFPAGALREERRASHVFALAALGRLRQAKLEADAFARDWPNSPLLDRVRAAGAASK